LKKIKEKVSRPEKLIEFDILLDLASVYEAWDEFNLEIAVDKIERVIKNIKRFSLYNEHLNKLEKQEKLINFLNSSFQKDEIKLEDLRNKRLIVNVIFSLYTKGIRQEKLKNYDLAALLFYRIQEMMSQRRLALYGVHTAHPKLNKEKKEEYLNKMNEIAKKEKSLNKIGQFPEEIGNLRGYILLAALGDPLVEDINWNKFVGTIKARNQSIFAHGYEFIKKDTYKDFKDVVIELLNKFCSIEDIEKQKMIDECSFIEV
jgi:CRISPR-associated protein (TIGR02710 family)